MGNRLVLLVIPALYLVSTVRAASVLWVSPSGIDADGRGTDTAPYQSLCYAVSRAASGDTVILTAGEYRETVQCIAKSGVTVRGSGSIGTAKTTVFAPISWNFSADGWTEKAEGYVIRIDNVDRFSLSGIEFQGNDHHANGAIYCSNSSNITISDFSVIDFRYYGMHFMSSTGIDLSSGRIVNSGFEQGQKAGSPFPDGGSLGNLGIHGVSHSRFHDISISTTEPHGYGMKMSGLDYCEFARMRFDMYPFQSWNSPDGSPGGGNFDFEIHGGHAAMVEIHHCLFTATLSCMGGSGLRYDTIPYSIHLHHNRFDLGGDYGIELGTDKMVVDHNYFSDTWACMQNYGGSETRITGLTFCHNICQNIGMRVIGSGGKLDKVRFYNNTVLMADDGWQSYVFTQEYQNGSTDWVLANNIILGDAGQTSENQAVLSIGGATPVKNITMINNCYFREQLSVAMDDGATADPAQWGYLISGNINRDPALPLSGTKPSQAFYPAAGTPPVDNGDNAYGMFTLYAGSGRDIGAYESGQPAWNVGPDAADTCQYVWAPRTSYNRSAFVDTARVDLFTAESDAEIRYTLDGSEPGPDAALYTGVPVPITQPSKLRARTFKNGWGSPDALILNLNKGVEGYPDKALDGTYSASSTYDAGLYGPEKAFDGETYSWVGWCPSGTDALPWLKVDLKQAYTIKYVELYTRSQVGSGDDSSRRNFQIQGSNDPGFGQFTVLAEQGATAIPYEGVFSATVTEPMAFRYVRAIKTVANEGFFITELKIRCDAADSPVFGRHIAVAGKSPSWGFDAGTNGRKRLWVCIGTPTFIKAELVGLSGRTMHIIHAKRLPSGRHEFTLGQAAAGVYNVRLQVGTIVTVKPLVIP